MSLVANMSLVEKKSAFRTAGDAGNSAHRGQFISLEIGRFIAALLVVLFHVDSAGHKFYGHYFADNIFRSGHAGVEFFFVLSGFIIFYVHRKDIENATGGASFMMRRIVRIIPMYWLALACVVIAYALSPAARQGRLFSIQDYIFDFLLIPRHGEMALSVAWTLRQEFVFYFIFLASIKIRGAGLWPILLWQAVIML